MPWVEVGDAVRIITNTDIVETFVMQRVTSGTQAMRDKIESTGSKQREEVFGINKQILQLEGKTTVIIKNVDEVSVRVTDLKKQEEAHFKITSEAIQAEVTRAIGEEEKLSGRITVNATNITAEVTRASKAEGELSGRITVEAGRITQEVNDKKNGEHTLNTKIDQTASKITLEVSQNYVGNGQISSKLSLEAGKVTLESNRLIVKSTNFKLDENGNADFSGRITGGSININNTFKVDTDGNTTITGNKLSWTSTNSSMTANGTLTCKNVKVESGTFSGAITGGSINIGNVFTVSNAGKVKITGNSLEWQSDYSSMTSRGVFTCTSGNIAGWEIGNGYMRSKDAHNRYVGVGVFGTAFAFYAGGTATNGEDGVFRVGHEGELKATRAIISGDITANSGSIAKYSISGNDLISGNVGMSSVTSSGSVAFWAGNSNRNSAPFRVTNQGKLYATNAEISGAITGSAISGSSITGGTISIGHYFYADSNGIDLGAFNVNNEYGRGVLESNDGCTGMSNKSAGKSKLYFWAGWNRSSNPGSTAVLAVNNNSEVHVGGKLFINGMDVEAAIRALQGGSGSGCNCDGDSGSGCNCDGDDEGIWGCGPGTHTE